MSTNFTRIIHESLIYDLRNKKKDWWLCYSIPYINSVLCVSHSPCCQKIKKKERGIIKKGYWFWYVCSLYWKNWQLSSKTYQSSNDKKVVFAVNNVYVLNVIFFFFKNHQNEKFHNVRDTNVTKICTLTG